MRCRPPWRTGGGSNTSLSTTVIPWIGCGMVPFVACDSCDKISVCSSDKKESLNLPKDLAADFRCKLLCNNDNGIQPTCGEAVYGICFRNINDSFRQKIIWINEVQRTRELDSYLVQKIVLVIRGWCHRKRECSSRCSLTLFCTSHMLTQHLISAVALIRNQGLTETGFLGASRGSVSAGYSTSRESKIS